MGGDTEETPGEGGGRSKRREWNSRVQKVAVFHRTEKPPGGT